MKFQKLFTVQINYIIYITSNIHIVVLVLVKNAIKISLYKIKIIFFKL